MFIRILFNDVQELKIWAFPQLPGTYEDVLVACYLENPKPFTVKVLCYGINPQLEIANKHVSFDRVLVHRLVPTGSLLFIAVYQCTG